MQNKENKLDKPVLHGEQHGMTLRRPISQGHSIHTLTKVLFKIQKVVGECINNMLEGNPINAPPQTTRSPVATNIMHTNPLNAAARDQLSFFAGQQQQPISYDST